MKRKAILIGNTSGLPGVKVDISRYKTFLKSNAGGAWYDEEIEIFQNEDKNNLLRKIDLIKGQSYDYVVVLFSGHGGQLRQTMLEINSAEETIEEVSLRYIARRQMNIYDCCRVMHPMAIKSAATKSLQFSYNESVNYFRQRYEDRIMQAIPQQVLLFSCSIGESSYDTANGAVYLGYFLEAATQFNQGQEFKLVSIAHQEAVPKTSKFSLNEKDGPQTPEASLPKCLSSQQLIISLQR